MASLPRILTVDPTGKIPQQVRGAVDLMDRLIIQIDVPGGTEALEELKRARCTAVISAWTPGGGMAGWELAAKIKQINQDTPIIILADIQDTELDEEMRSASPFIYLKRPFDMAQFLRVLTAALDGEDVAAALNPPETAVATAAAATRYSPVPEMKRDRAGGLLHQLMTDVSAAAVLLCSRESQVIVEQGVVGYMNRDDLTHRLTPGVIANIELRDLLHGNVNALQFYDGEEYDVYVISVGFHHFLVLVYDGKSGARMIGNVNRYARRCAEDLIALLGMDAWFIEKITVEKKADAAPRRSEVVAQTVAKQVAKDEPPMELTSAFNTKKATSELEVIIPEAPRLEAIADDDFNLDDIFGAAVNADEADDLFSLANLEEIVKDDGSARKGTITWDDAMNLGLVGNGGGGN